MNTKLKNYTRRGMALALALILTAGLSSTALADGAQLPATHEETYYATLNYYGGVTDSSVVKSYKTYGNDTITDYGVYAAVNNLTNDLSPTLGDGSVTFQLGADAPSRFYFEGKPKKPLEEFPWTLSLSYALNGVPTLAEDLAGKEGVVEITLNAVPNQNASVYSRNNLVLTAMSMFNGDDILSLKAQGAQVQMIGNLYCVLYMVMPGEEQHVTIQVGSENFVYSGMIFLAVPATLAQLEQLTDLREAKGKAEDSYYAIQDSMDVILNSLDGMSGSLNATADGLDQLNKARETISNGKSQVYDSLDVALAASGPLTEAMKPMADHLATAQQALADTTPLLNEMSDNMVALKPEVENTRKLLKELQSELKELRELLDDSEKLPANSARVAKNLSADFGRLGSSLYDLEQSMKSMRGELSGLNQSLAGVAGDTEVTIDLGNGPMTVPQIKAQVQQVNAAYRQYEALLTNGTLPAGTSFHDFLINPALGGKGEAEATAIVSLWEAAKTAEYTAKLERAEQLNTMLKDFNMNVSQLKALVSTVNDTGSPVLKQLETLCSALGPSSLSGDLSRLSTLMEDLTNHIDEHSGTLSATAATLKSTAALGIRVSGNVDTALEQVQSLTELMNTYTPKAQAALEDAKSFSASASTSISALADAARATEALLKTSGSDLDVGTKQALAGLSKTLRKSTQGLSQTDTIRRAKSTLDALITDEWESHTGGDNNMLLIDTLAPPISLTDARNEGTASIQYVIRTQEIKLTEPEEVSQPIVSKADKGTLFTRISDMFKDLWHVVTGWLH